MKKTGLLLAVGAMTLVVSATSHAADTEKKASAAVSIADKVSYAAGYQFGGEMPANMSVAQFIQGLQDARAKKPMPYSNDELSQAMETYQQDARDALDRQIQANKAAGKAFLAGNAKKPGVITTASGLQYQVLKQGGGKRPTETSEVSVHYEGRLLDGTVFDSSIARKEPVTFALNQVIPGWTEGVQLMKEGGKYRFFIPAELAYGDESVGAIPVSSTLIFDVELISVVSQK